MRLFTVLALAFAAVTMTFAQPSSKQIITTGGNSTLPFSPAVKADGLIYVAGMLGNNASGVIAKGDVKAQTKQTLENISATLKAGGSSLANAASVLVYLRNASDFAAMNEVYSTHWTKDPPARTTVVVTQPLANPDGLVEISIVPGVGTPSVAVATKVTGEPWSPATDAVVVCCRRFIRVRTAMSGRNESASKKKHQNGPAAERAAPAITGPIARESLNCSEFIITAFGRRVRSSSRSMTIA